MTAAGTSPAGDAAYRVAWALAEDMLGQGLVVIADAVNPLGRLRAAWRDLATRTGQPLVEVEIVRADAPRPVGDYEPWPEPHVVVDTTGRTADQSVTEILSAL